MNQACKRLGQVCKRLTQRTFSTFMAAENTGYVEKMYEAWQKDPKSVHPSWAEYFKGAAGTGAKAVSTEDIGMHLRAMQLVNAYQLKGHEVADLDPLCKRSRNDPL